MPYNNPIKKKDSACKQLKSETGKPSGLMMEGSVAYQESAEQEKKDLMKDMPIDNKASALTMGHEDSPAEMGHSPMEMGHESPAKNVNKGYGYETPKPSVAKMGHESPAKFTGMSGGSAMHMSPLYDNHDYDERSGKGKSMTEGIELSEATASLSDMYKRDAAMKVPAFPNFTTTSAGYTQVGGEGSIEPFPSAVYIGKGTSVPGVGRTFSEKEISAGRKKYEGLVERKKKAQDYLAANK